MKRTYYGHILVIWILQALAVVLVGNQPLFWDNVLLTGKIPTQLWERGLTTVFVDNELAGYSPLWGLYIAQGWVWLGRSLMTTHLLMLPFLWLLAFQLVRLAQQFVARRALGLTVLLLHSVPVLVALSVQCGPDLAMLGLFFTALNAILLRNRAWLSVVLILLALISPRGMWCLVPLYVIDQCLLGNKFFATRWLWVLSKSMAYLPAAIAVIVWYSAHHNQYGWLFVDPKGDFASLAAYTTFSEYLRQLGIAVWRMIDFGQIALWLPLMGIVFAILRKKVEEAQNRGVLALLTFLPMLAFAFFFAAFRNPIGHRYMLIPVLMGGLWLCYEWSEGLRYAGFRSRVLVVLFFFWTGHLWVAFYPSTIAKGWDATLAHLQVGAAKRDMKTSLEAMPLAQQAGIGARFPDADAWAYAFLDSSQVLPTLLDTHTNMYWLYSTVSNDFEPTDLAYIQQHGDLQIRCTYWPVSLELWRAKAVHTTPTPQSVF